jgi:hypothetical protein
VLAPLYCLLGAMFVSIDLSTISFAQHFVHEPVLPAALLSPN